MQSFFFIRSRAVLNISYCIEASVLEYANIKKISIKQAHLTAEFSENVSQNTH